MRLARGATTVSWVNGTVELQVGEDVLLVDAPAGAAERLPAASLGRTRGIVCTSGRIQAVGGLVPLLCALERHRGPDDTVVLQVPLGDDRAAALAEAWTRGWPDRYPLTIDAQRPGAAVPSELAGVEVETVRVRTGDVRWATAEVEPGVGMALRLTSPDLAVAVILGAAPDRRGWPPSPGSGASARRAPLERLCDGADLAIVEVGVTDWPRTDEPWRIRVDEVPALAAGAREVWVVGDDGRPVPAGAA
jgi:hypothetical protein